MTPAEHLTKLIREKVPRLMDWEVEGLVKWLMENNVKPVKVIGVANMGKKAGTTEVDFAESFTGYNGLIYGDKE